MFSRQSFWYDTPQPYEKGRYFEEDWENRHEEVLFPARHVPHKPWKPFQWEVDNKMPFYHPVMRSYQNVKVPIGDLFHVTHRQDFAAICEENPGFYTLKSNKKMGKSAPAGHSFVACDPREFPNRESFYRYVKPEESLLPGSYVWWSVAIDPPKDYPEGFKVSNPFSNPLQSPYGSKMIRGYKKHVLEAYQASFLLDDANKLPRIEFRNGGTLRYKFEICHVIIVCACYNGKEPPLPLDQYPLWNDGKIRHYHEYKSGAVRFVDPLEITIRNGIKCKYFGDVLQVYSWDNFAFAFHFPEDKQEMICPKSIFKADNIEHDDDVCIKKKMTSNGLQCPDDC